VLSLEVARLQVDRRVTREGCGHAFLEMAGVFDAVEHIAIVQIDLMFVCLTRMEAWSMYMMVRRV